MRIFDAMYDFLVYLGIFRKAESAVKEENVETLEKKKKKRKIELDTDTNFKVIDRFDSDSYVRDTFDEVLKAVVVDEWEFELKSDEIEFRKDGIKLIVTYGTWNCFVIKKIEIKNGYVTFRYSSDLDEDIYEYFYGIYERQNRLANERLKSRAEDKMSEIRKVIGEDTIRDGKIDFLLNSEEDE